MRSRKRYPMITDDSKKIDGNVIKKRTHRISKSYGANETPWQSVP